MRVVQCASVVFLCLCLGCGEQDGGGNDIIVPVGKKTNSSTTMASTTSSTSMATATASTQTTMMTSMTSSSTSTATATATSTGTMSLKLPDVVISEIAPYLDPDFENREWFELYNTTDKPIDLTGWLYTDNCTYLSRNSFEPGTMIEPGGYLQVFVTKGVDFAIGDPDPDLCVSNPQSVVITRTNWSVDQVSWTRTLGIWPNVTGSFYVMDSPTPGAPNKIPLALACGNGTLDEREICDGDKFGEDKTCQDLQYLSGTLGCNSDCTLDESQCEKAQSDVVINEVVSTFSDAVELYNRGTQPVNLKGWRLGSQFYPLSSAYAYLVTQDEMLAPGEYRVFERDVNTGGVSLFLRDEVTLYNQASEVLDRVVYSEGKAQVSYCRQPNGSGDFKTCVRSSIGASND